MITVTPAAQAYLQSKIEKEQGMGFRLSIKKTGCSGYSYVPSVAKEKQPNDVLVDMAGLTILLDAAWKEMLMDVIIDYREDESNGLKQKRLVFTNQKESGRCGCGESFHIE